MSAPNYTYASFTSEKAGTYSVTPTVSDSGGGVYQTSAATWSLTVNKANTQLTNVSGQGDAGQSNGSLTAKLSSFKTDNTTVNKNLANKTVTFKIDGTSVPGSATTDANGVATLNNVNLAGVSAGSHTVTATFAGDDGYLTSSGTGSMTANQTQQTTQVGSITASTSTYGGTTNLSAAVSPAGAPGSVAFYVNGSTTAATGTVTYNSSTGVATLSNYSHGLNASNTPYSVKAVFTSSSSSTYSNSEATNSSALTVNKAAATLTLGGLSQTYDGTAKAATATTEPANLSGVTIKYDGSTSAPTDAGSYAVVASLSNSNYEADDANGTLVIARASQTIDFDELANATYGDADIPLSATASSGLPVSFSADGDCELDEDGTTLSITGAGTCSVTATQDGNSNYSAASSVTRSFTINPKSLTGSFTAENKEYDGTTAAIASPDPLAGVVGDDEVQLEVSNAQFEDKNVADDKDVTATLALTGDGADNYALTSTTGTAKADITAKSLTGSFTAKDKTYDGTDAAEITATSLDGVIGTDKVTLDYSAATATFVDKNVGNGKTVTGTGFVLSGDDATNYALGSVSDTTANITAKELTGSFTAQNKTYDGNTSATIATRTLGPGAITGDDVELTGGTATFANKNVGNGKTVTGSGFELSGDDAGNYSLGSVSDTTASITAKELTGSFTAQNKEYDGTTAATVSPDSLDGVVSGDTVNLDVTNAQFEDENVGTGKTVTADLVLSGADASNYKLANTTASATADITQRDLTVSAEGVNKTYDGTAAATVTLTTDALSGDAVTASYASASFADENAGAGKAVSVNGISISGADASNYKLANTTANTTADITQREITVSAVSDSKTYDSTTSSDETPKITVGSLASGDTASFSQSFDNKNVGTGKTLTPSASVSDGNGGNNYKVTYANNTNGEITALSLTVSASGVDKVYDGSKNATVNLTTNELDGDDVTATYASASFADKNVGNGKTVSVSGISLSGADAGNYTFNTTASTTADITARSLTVSASGVNKVYDGNTDAIVNLSDNRVTGDSLTTNYASASFADENVGNGKAVSVSGITVTGTDAGNYTFNTTASTTADITARSITVTAEAKSKPFGATDPALTYQVSGGPLVSGDSFTGSLSRDPGEAVGQYNILQGTVKVSDGNSGNNYAINYVGAKLTIGAWHARGFYDPVGTDSSIVQAPNTPVPAVTTSTVWNSAKGGSTVPLKFNVYESVGGTEKTSTTDVKGFEAKQLSSCSTAGAEDPVDYFATTGSTSLRYDSTAKQFIQNWKTPTVSKDTCFRVAVTFQDGTAIHAYFKLRK